MSQLAHLRQKIKSIQTTKKITHAVRLISMSFYNKLEKNYQPLSLYSTNLRTLFGHLLLHAKDWANETFLPHDLLDRRPLFVIVSTSKGLCGGLNSNLLKYFEQSLFLEPHQQPSFIAIGSKAITYIKGRKLTTLVSVYNEVNSSNLFALTEELIAKILFSDANYTSVSFFSNEARSFFSQRPLKTTVLPLSVTMLKNDYDNAFDPDIEPELIWEQDTQMVLDRLAMRYLHSSIMHILFGAMRAEQAARFLAMDNSTNNAEKYLEPLIMQFNKMRQALITKEISECVSGRPGR